MTTSRTFYALFSALKQNAVKFKVPELTLVLVGMGLVKNFKASTIAYP